MLISEGSSKDSDWSSLSLKATHRDRLVEYPDEQQWWFRTNHYLQRTRQLGGVEIWPLPFSLGASSIYSSLGQQGDAIWQLKKRAIDSLGRPHTHMWAQFVPLLYLGEVVSGVEEANHHHLVRSSTSTLDMSSNRVIGMNNVIKLKYAVVKYDTPVYMLLMKLELPLNVVEVFLLPWVIYWKLKINYISFYLLLQARIKEQILREELVNYCYKSVQ